MIFRGPGPPKMIPNKVKFWPASWDPTSALVALFLKLGRFWRATMAPRSSKTLPRRHQEPKRLQKVGYPILKNNADLCENTINSLGIIFNAYASEEKYSEIEKEVYEIDDKLKLTFVIPSSAAFKSGLRNNDEIISINGIDATQNIEKFHKDLDILRKKSETLNVTYKRKDIVDTLSFDPELICNYPILLVQNDSVNAFANGSQIGITTGMIRFAQKDDKPGVVPMILQNLLRERKAVRKVGKIKERCKQKE